MAAKLKGEEQGVGCEERKCQRNILKINHVYRSSQERGL